MEVASFITDVAAKALPLFMILDPFGAVGLVVPILQPFKPQHQRKILRREMSLVLVVMMVFYFGGGPFLAILGISQAAVQITGGAVFILFAVTLLFPNSEHQTSDVSEQEPFLVPIAIPLIAGPSTLATVILYSHASESPTVVLTAIIVAWLGAACFVLPAPWIAQKIGPIGIKVAERIIGLICTLLACNMLLKGASTFLGPLPTP